MGRSERDVVTGSGAAEGERGPSCPRVMSLVVYHANNGSSSIFFSGDDSASIVGRSVGALATTKRAPDLRRVGAEEGRSSAQRGDAALKTASATLSRKRSNMSHS